MKPLRKASVMFKDRPAGSIEETGEGYRFSYDPAYLAGGVPIAVAFPLQAQPYESKTLFPFFKGLLPEGWFRDIVCQTLKIDSKDKFGLLVKACGDCIGAVWIKQ
ncbi:MAG: HipA N-terminal domain-containing protein [Kiritimatiellae bacterium]|nr:HipA N-terminal domain-containing protein [Kiritimatiellia bacterium]